MANPSTSTCAAPPSKLEIGFLENPFAGYEGSIDKWAKGPRGPRTAWRRVMSCVWAIFRVAAEWRAVWNPACEWGAAFDRAFIPPYANVVLPACYEALGDPFGRLLRHLEELLETVGTTRDAETIKQHLVRMEVLARSVERH